jgi:hypothetical protein
VDVGRAGRVLVLHLGEVGPTGVRVVDRGQIHQDHAVVVRMLVAALARQRPRWSGLPISVGGPASENPLLSVGLHDGGGRGWRDDI